MEVSGHGSLGDHVFTLLEGTTGQASQLAPGREADMDERDEQGRSADPQKLASRLRFNPDFAAKVYGRITPGTTVIMTDQPVVRKPVADSTYFAAN